MFKKSLLSLMIGAMVFGMSCHKSVFATSKDAEIKKLEYQINSLSKKIDNLKFQNQGDIASSILDNIQFHGRMHIEFLHSNNNGDALYSLGGNNGKSKMDNVEFSAVKLQAKKKITDNSTFALAVKAGDGTLKLQELYFNHDFTDKLSLSLGLIEFPYTLEGDNVNNILPFTQESKLYNAGPLIPARAIGLKLSYFDDNYGVYSGVYGNAADEDMSEVNNVLFNLKGYYNPYKNGENLVHLGLYYLNVASSYNKTPSIIDGNDWSYDLKNLQIVGAEFALNYNWFNFQSEYVLGYAKPANVDYKKTFDLSNYYAQITLFLTGETLKYDGGSFYELEVKNPLSKGGFGAFELAFKFAGTDLQDNKDGKIFDYGKYDDYSVAFSWYPENYFKTTIQYSYIKENFKESNLVDANNGKEKNNYGVIALKNKVFF